MKFYGDLHTHTVNSDGNSTIADNVVAAKSAGLQQVAITDHGHGKLLGRRLDKKKYPLVKAQIEQAKKEHNIDVLFGVEANITGVNGELDIRNRERGNFDIFLCGIHRVVKPYNIKSLFTFFLPNYFWALLHWFPKGRIAKNTKVVTNAVEKNNIDILVHPGRYFKVNVLEVAKICCERGTAMELNAKKISFRPIDFERMISLGVKFTIGSDAHWSKNVGKFDRVTEFLKLCDYDESVFLNLNKPFVRPKPQIMQKVIEEENGNI